jgi:hypothetical protein
MTCHAVALYLSGPPWATEKGNIMAKTVDLSEAMAAFASLGIKFTDKQIADLQAAKVKVMLQPALEIFSGNGDNLPGKATDKTEENAARWVNLSFEWAEAVSNGIVGETKKIQGGAVRTVRQFGIDTPHGHFTVQLKSD